jgi:hypothetical protein
MWNSLLSRYTATDAIYLALEAQTVVREEAGGGGLGGIGISGTYIIDSEVVQIIEKNHGTVIGEQNLKATEDEIPDFSEKSGI